MAIDWSKQYRDHRGQWVALRKDEVTVVASGKTAKEVLNRARAKGYKKPILFRVPTKIIPYIGGIGQ